MKPGMELDALIAEKVMGWKKISGTRNITYKFISSHPFAKSNHLIPPEVYAYLMEFNELPTNELYYSPDIPNYSTNIFHTFQIIKEIESWGVTGEFSLERDYEGLWHCVFNGTNEKGTFKGQEHNADTASQAICLAALNIFGGEELTTHP